MKLMATYGTLHPTDNITQRNFKRGGVMETKDFMYTEVVANNFYIKIKLITTTTGGMHPSPLRKIGLQNIGLIVALLGILKSQK